MVLGYHVFDVVVLPAMRFDHELFKSVIENIKDYWESNICQIN